MFTEDVDNVGGYAYVGGRRHAKSLASAPFCCEPKTTLKNIIKKP